MFCSSASSLICLFLTLSFWQPAPCSAAYFTRSNFDQPVFLHNVASQPSPLAAVGMTDYLQQQQQQQPEQQGVVQVYPCPFPSAFAPPSSPLPKHTQSQPDRRRCCCCCHMQASTDPPGAYTTPLLMLGVSLSWTMAPTACEQGAWHNSSEPAPWEHSSRPLQYSAECRLDSMPGLFCWRPVCWCRQSLASCSLCCWCCDELQLPLLAV